jgi:hypothetical protein
LSGGYAFAFHAEPRYTKDLDIWIEPSADNAAAVWRALVTFGAPVTDITPADLASPAMVVQLGVAPNRIDIVTSIDGVSFQEAWTHRVDARHGDVPVHLIGREEFIKNKRAVGRPQDLIDVERLTRKH